MANKGSTTIDFGSAPGTNYIVVTITGETSILSGSVADAFIMASDTATHNSYEHSIVPITLRCGNVVAGSGFDIVATSELRLTGTFTVQWVWA
jgi:hypothetical protein